MADDLSEYRYKAPALEKGLDILELLSSQTQPLTLSQISSELGRSVGEIFRMVQVLVNRGYINTANKGGGLVLSPKLFTLGTGLELTNHLAHTAQPLLQSLSDRTYQSSYLTIVAEAHAITLARAEPPSDHYFSVRIGSKWRFLGSATGLVLYAFMDDLSRSRLCARICQEVAPDVWKAFESRVSETRDLGHAVVRSTSTDSVTDIAAPVLVCGQLAGAVNISHLRTRLGLDPEDCLQPLLSTARLIAETSKGLPSHIDDDR